MQLTVFNGSPRGKKSNSTLLLENFLKGFYSEEGGSCETYHLNRVKETDIHVEAFQKAENVILIFPLYTDAMPGVVKHFIEALEPLCGRDSNPSLGFIIQSGFPEPENSLHLQRYIEKLAKRLGCRYTRTAIRGGVEGIQVQPPWMTKKVFGFFNELGKGYAKTGLFDEKIIHKLAPRARMSFSRILLFRFFGVFGLTNFYWNMMLKKHNAYENRFAHPFKDF